MEEAGQASRADILGMQAEAELTLAEVKMCEVNSQRIKEALEAAEAGKLKLGDKGARVFNREIERLQRENAELQRRLQEEKSR